MKRKVLCLILSLALLLSLSLTVSANENLRRVVDEADLLSDSEESALEESARLLREAYNMDVVILTVNTLDGKRPQDYADDYYDYNGYGCGEEKSGLLLLISMEERDWYISTCGNAIYALTDYGIQCVGDVMLSGFSTDYATGFGMLLDALPEYFEAFQNSNPIDGYADYSGDYYHGDQEEVVYYEEEFTPSVEVSAVFGFVYAFMWLVIKWIGMNTKRPKHSAAGYMKENSFQLRQQQDLFLYSNVSKERREESSSSGGGSSVHTSSSGSSHGGGGGKF